MPNFRPPEKQAAHIVRAALALGQPRHGQAAEGRVHSLRSAQNYESALRLVAVWLRDNGHQDGLHRITPDLARAYLAERAEVVTQSTLDQDRHALRLIPGLGTLERVKSELGRGTLATQGRAYTPAQVEMIAAAQAPRNALATRIAHAAGLRAHELLTLRRADEQRPSAHRAWSPDRFVGREGVRYAVTGKGGLVREVLLPPALAADLERTRLAAPRTVEDRGIRYRQSYDLAGGQVWGRSYSAASRRALGWSTGAHGLRHGYAQTRLDEIQGRGYVYADALAIVSQELGHFRPEITETYLR